MAMPSLALVKCEQLSNLRRCRSALILALFAGAMILTIGLAWPKGNFNLMDASYISRMMFSLMFFILTAGSALFMPGLAAASVIGEEEMGSFDMLNVTLIRPSGIVVGKFLSAIGFYMLLMVSVLPVLGTVLFLVGIDWVEFFQSFALLMAFTASCAMAGIFVSTYANRSIVAIIGGYVTVGIVGFLPVIVAMVIAAMPGNRGVDIYAEALAMICTPALVLDFPGRSMSYYFLALGYQVLWLAIYFLLAVRKIRKGIEPPKVKNEKSIEEKKQLALRRGVFPFYLIDPLRKKKPIEDGRNPMMVKELRWGFMSNSATLLRMFYITLVLFVLIGCWHPYPVLFVSTIIAPALLANALTKEYELGNIDMLWMTLMKPRQVVLGKMFAGVVVITPIMLSALIVVLIFGHYNTMMEYYGALFIASYVNLAVCMMVTLRISLFSSLISTRTGVAVVSSYFLSGLIIFVLPVLLTLLDEFDYIDIRSRAIAYFSPLFALSSLERELRWRHGSY